MGSFNTPAWFFRARLGFLFGHRVVMLEHTGRRSDRLRQTPLAVIRRQDNSYTVCSETGPDADWYRNIKANPATRMWVGSHRYDVEQRFLDDSEAATALARCEADRPKTAARLTSRLGMPHDGTHQGRMKMVREIPMVELRLMVG
ncbi:MAG: nitroreductase family deazaflavin-dependent oxidoreductase [bacterium]|nr:nitroreductase family deazaflavin-dependent oxidoreductase [bacterium]